MTFVNCFGAIYTLPCTVLLTRIHTLKIILLDRFYLLFFLLFLLFCWDCYYTCPNHYINILYIGVYIVNKTFVIAINEVGEALRGTREGPVIEYLYLLRDCGQVCFYETVDAILFIAMNMHINGRFHRHNGF